ncbi:MAG: DUF2911 domain-containing protein [Chitinophagaceae bacterium]|nr:MAG: DUF2911 domain-containing protein [Chitinophagaceae bacterium]
MKKFLLVAMLFSNFLSGEAQQITTAQASPTQNLKQNFGLGSIELNYSRPGLKDRKIGTNDFVPYGKVWRTGANGATTLQFSDDVTIGGKLIKAGKYGLLSIPDNNDWTLIITTDLTVTSPGQYKQENDVVRVKAPVRKLAEKVETFTINFSNITNNSTELQLSFDNALVTLPIVTGTDEKVMKQIDNLLAKDNRPFYAAALYYFENGKDIAKAKEWIDKAAADPANAKSLNVTWLKARIYQKAGDKAGAKASAEKLLSIATETKNDDFIKRAQEFLKGL